MPLMQPPDWREGYKLTGADIDGALDDAAAATTGITRDQLADDARFSLSQFAEQGCDGCTSVWLYTELILGPNNYRAYSLLTIPRGGGSIRGVDFTTAPTTSYFTKNGEVVATPFDVVDDDEVWLNIESNIEDNYFATVRSKWRQQR